LEPNTHSHNTGSTVVAVVTVVAAAVALILAILSAAGAIIAAFVSLHDLGFRLVEAVACGLRANVTS
jgi:hypothetical protein